MMKIYKGGNSTGDTYSQKEGGRGANHENSRGQLYSGHLFPRGEGRGANELHLPITHIPLLLHGSNDACLPGINYVPKEMPGVDRAIG